MKTGIAALLLYLFVWGGIHVAMCQDTLPSIPDCPEVDTRPLLGGQLFTSGEEVIVTIRFSESAIFNGLLLYLTGRSPVPVATAKDQGRPVSLGRFRVGSELLFGMTMLPGGEISYRMGPGERNSDGIPHAVTQLMGNGEALVYFEDMPKGGDRDYDDLIFHVTGVMEPVRLSFRPAPSPLLPSSLLRTYTDARKTLRVYPFPERKRSFPMAVKVCGLGTRPPPLSLRVSIAGQEGSGGHLPRSHPGPRAHGWLLPSLPPTEEPEVPGRNHASLTLPELNGPPEDVFASSQKEIPLRQNDPGGETKVHFIDLEANEDGIIHFGYLPPETSGVEILKAEIPDALWVEPVFLTLTVKTEGLIDLREEPKPTWKILPSRKSHEDNVWVAPYTREKLIQAGEFYRRKQNEDKELQGWILSLYQMNYDFPYLLSKNLILLGGPEPLHLLEASLPWGGLLDPSGDYATPRWGHREGKEVDLMTKHLVRGDPLRATWNETLGDARLTGETEKNTLVRRIQFRRLELMKSAIQEAGGKFIPEEAHFTEGDHLHVSFETMDPQPPSQAEPSRTSPVTGPGSPGLRPANPNHLLK